MAFGSVFVFFLLTNLLLLHSAEEEKSTRPNCPSFPCGKFGTIGFPFTNVSYPSCGLLPVNCDETPPKIQLPLGLSGKPYEVINISYTNFTQSIRIKDFSLLEFLNTSECQYLINFTLPYSPFISFKLTTPNLTLFKCNRIPNITSTLDLKYMSCGEYDLYYNNSKPAFASLCPIIQLPEKWHAIKYGFKLAAEYDLKIHVSDACSGCYSRGGLCELGKEGNFNCSITPITEKGNNTGSNTGNNAGSNIGNNARNNTGSNTRSKRLNVMVIATSSVAIGVLMVIICCFWRKFKIIKSINFWKKFKLIKSINFWKKETLTHKSVEAFLKSHGPLVVRRYNYADIKTMTKSFNDKLGQGGYGSVYKGKLQDGCFVAVKVMKESKGNGEEFLNEVASISRTSHVNIVTLKGFCFEGSKKALIYELMPNGSLEKFIYKGNPSSSNHHLGWETLYKIAIGIARGLEYLHRGCNTRILHFDIKPHNILLDENFCPKISDFGLAKICPREKSTISMVGARGTTGYIAPEVFCRSFGGISHKSDVYSYGMMVLEMVGGRKNIDVSVDFTSEIYFPHWIYKRLELNEELGLLGLLEEGDEDTARKMIIVSLWCIQTNPSNRPSMSKVVDMLEGSLDSLQIPPKPYLFSPPRSPIDSSTVMMSMQYDSMH